MRKYLLLTSELFRVAPAETVEGETIAVIAEKKLSLPMFVPDYNGVLIPIRENESVDALVETYRERLSASGFDDVAGLLCETSGRGGYEHLEMHIVDENDELHDISELSL